MPVVAPNVLNTLRASRLLLLMEHERNARVFESPMEILEIYVPSEHGGRLRVGFGAAFREATHGLVLEGSNGQTARADPKTGEAHIDFEPGKRGDGICRAYVAAPTGKFSIYALFDEIAFARDADGTPLIPWNFWYFPYSHREPDTAWAGKHAGPLQRYMEAFGVTSALAWELEHHDDPSGTREGWEGHCDDAAAASILFHPPPDQGLSHNGVHFNAEELKFYGVEYFGRFGLLKRRWTLPEPVERVREGFHHQFKPNDDPRMFGQQQVLGSFLSALRKHIRDQGTPLRMDMRDNGGSVYTQVWNHAVYRYAIRYWQPDVTDPRRTTGELILSANDDFMPQDGSSSGVPADVERVGGTRVVVPNGTGRDLRIEFSMEFRASGKMDLESDYNEWWSVRRWDPRNETTTGELLFAPRDAFEIVKPDVVIVEGQRAFP